MSGLAVTGYYSFLKEISRQNHTLIAGATGSGKSVVINQFISAYILGNKFPLSYKKQDKENTCGLVLIDPKRVELSIYKNLPHTMCHATEPEQIETAICEAEKIMDSRYKVMQKKGLRKWCGQDIYIIVDEFIEIASIKATQETIKRIATLGRAANVHMIIATQRPSISDRLMPAVLRANIDCTVCLRTKEAKDSRMICGHEGAEKFPRPVDVGHAECFFCTPGTEEHYKFGMLSDEQIDAQVRFWKKPFSRFTQTKINLTGGKNEKHFSVWNAIKGVFARMPAKGRTSKKRGRSKRSVLGYFGI